jgi:hypothetical protein
MICHTNENPACHDQSISKATSTDRPYSYIFPYVSKQGHISISIYPGPTKTHQQLPQIKNDSAKREPNRNDVVIHIF